MALASHFQFVTVELVFGTGVENSKNSTLLDCKPKVFHKKLHGGTTPRDVCACFTMFDASQCGLGPFHMFASFTIFTLNVSLFVVLIEGRMGGWVKTIVQYSATDNNHGSVTLPFHRRALIRKIRFD